MIKRAGKNKHIKRFILLIFILTIWEILYIIKIFPAQLFPSIGQIINALGKDLVDGKLIIQTGKSLVLIFEGLIVGLGISIILSFLGYFSKTTSEILSSLIAILDPLPGVAILPLVIIWIGIGEKAILFIILHSIIWPLVISIQTGLKGIDPLYIEAAKINKISNLQLFIYILLPLSLPQIIAGAKIGWSRAWRALISSEMIFGAIGSLGGIGWYLFEKRVFMDTAGMFAGLIVLIVISVLIEELLFFKLENYIEDRIS